MVRVGVWVVVMVVGVIVGVIVIQARCVGKPAPTGPFLRFGAARPYPEEREAAD